MTLSQETKNKIREEYSHWESIQYGSKSVEERQELGQFFTPAELTIKMIEKFDNLDGTILDPCAGCGGLLSACIIAGADPEKIYANEFDPEIVELCKQRLVPMGVPEWHIHCGDALDPHCYEFSEDYVWPKPTPKEVDLWGL